MGTIQTTNQRNTDMKKIDAGRYQITDRGVTFIIEEIESGKGWQCYAIEDGLEYYGDELEWVETFASLKDAGEWIKS